MQRRKAVDGNEACADPPDAARVIVNMRSGAGTVDATVRALGTATKVGVRAVTLYRPFRAADFVAALPPPVRALAIFDRMKESGATGNSIGDTGSSIRRRQIARKAAIYAELAAGAHPATQAAAHDSTGGVQ